LSYPSDELSDDITALVSTAPTLSTAAASIATIASGSDVLVSNFAGVEAVFTKLSAFLSELQSKHFYCPVGLISPFGGTSTFVPGGWLLCDGSAVSQSTYADLYAVLGANAYGTDAGGNFYLPDLRGRVVVGLGTHADVDARTDSDGIATLANRSPKHSHSIAGLGVTSSVGTLTANDAGAHSHTNRASNGGAIVDNNDGFNRGSSIQDHSFANTSGVGNHSHNVTGTINSSPTGTVGVGSGTLDTMPYGVANYIIKA